MMEFFHFYVCIYIESHVIGLNIKKVKINSKFCPIGSLMISFLLKHAAS